MKVLAVVVCLLTTPAYGQHRTKSLNQIRVEIRSAEAATMALMRRRWCPRPVVDYVRHVGNRCTTEGAFEPDPQDMPLAREILTSPQLRAWVAATKAYVDKVKK